MMELLDNQTEALIERALAEDLGQGDITTETLVPNDMQGKAILLAKTKGIIAGTEVARQVFLKVDPELKVEILIADGACIVPNDVIATIEGRIASILKAERVALNFLQHLSGIASETACYVETVKGLRVRIADTRKTMPGLRALQKYAVWIGGGKNHRMHLGDGFLIKDNHLVALRHQGLSMKEIITKARQKTSDKLTVEIEVKNLQEVAEAAEAGADIIMLDNMNLEDMHKAVKLIGGKALVEASGGMTLERLRAVAETGINLISVGALTHSVKALDISLELEIT
jgi:nicotinate-nucleotide pyrophosphorylase (carboxylating)